MIYLHVTVRVAYGKMREFHEYWAKEGLPLWEKCGAKHIGSWTTTIGKTNEVIRLFAFEDLAHFESYRNRKVHDESGEAEKVSKELGNYLLEGEQKVLVPASYSPLQ